MKVILLTNCCKGNPYQKNLADGLLKQGVKASIGIASFFKYGKPNILHLHWLHSLLLAKSKGKTILKSLGFFTGLVILKFLRVKIIWTSHNIKHHEQRFPSLELFFTKVATYFFDKIIVHSQSAKNEVKKVYKITDDSKFQVIPHGNYINNYENVISKVEARNHLGITEKELTFLYFGLIRPYKGIPQLINAFKKLNYMQTKLLIVGKPMNNEIAQDILSRCGEDRNIKPILRFVPDNEIQIYMNAADIVVLPYQDILTSGAAILAISFGKPIIAPAIGCIPDVLDNQGSFLYDPSKEEDLFKTMKHTLNADLPKMGKHNFELAKRLSWDEIGRQTHKVYQECLRRERRNQDAGKK